METNDTSRYKNIKVYKHGFSLVEIIENICPDKGDITYVDGNGKTMMMQMYHFCECDCMMTVT